MDNIEDLDLFVDRPFTPPSEEEMDAIEMECLGLTKEAADTAEVLKKKRENEATLLTAFQKKPSQETFSPLYESYLPIIMKASKGNMMHSTLPQAAHKMFAAQNFLDSIRTYKPSMGSFRSHMFGNVMQKGKRLNPKYQNIGYIPEARAMKYQAFKTTHQLLRDELEREPSAHEIADEMSLPVKEVERLTKEVRKSYILQEELPSLGASHLQSDKTLQAAHDFIHDLIPSHQVVLEYALGMNGKPSLHKESGGPDAAAIVKASGLGMNTVRSAFKTISRKMEAHIHQAGLLTTTDVEEAFPEEIER